MKREQFYISTIASDAVPIVRQYGLGLEIAQYCTAYNMDDLFAQTDATVREQLVGIPDRVFHGPFNELFPCAIDPRARELAACRYRQAIRLAKSYGASKIVIHGGYNPKIYYPCWYTEQSVLFWKAFLEEDPGIQIVLENVLEEEPGMLLQIVKAVDDSRLRLCLDTGHINAYSRVSVMTWLEEFAPWLSHFHLHNNSGDADTHRALSEGTIPMAALLRKADTLCPDATLTLEVPEADSSVGWLTENGII